MAKLSTIFSCSSCGAQFPKWSGRCLECGAWGSLKSEIVDNKEKEKRQMEMPAAELIDLAEIKGSAGQARIRTGVNEIDRVLGGGLVPGSFILLSGEPGIGKSTVVAQIADQLGRQAGEKIILYASGEESPAQVKDRLVRLKCDLKKIRFISETNSEKIISAAAALGPKCLLLIIDSIQTIYSPLSEGEAGGVVQIRASASRFLELAKQKNIAVMLIGHITKDGTVAGPKTLEHIVDTVIYLETENLHNYRILRTTKNRFGSVNEIGILEMTAEGFREIANPSGIFLAGLDNSHSGSALSATIEGARPFLMEIQALATKTIFGYPQRKASGLDLNRLQVLASVISKRTKINLSNQDIIVNIVGGLKVSDTALDLAVSAAIISSLSNLPISHQTLILGEVGLGGEVRSVARLDQRLAEAEKLGFTRAIMPDTDAKAGRIKPTRIKHLSQLVEAISAQ